MIKNKKAGERVLSIWMFLIWAIVGVSIVVGMIMFLSVQADARAAEAGLLVNKIIGCFDRNFKLEEFQDKDFDIYKTCRLNKQVFEAGDLHYLNVSLKELSSGKMSYSISKGTGVFEVQCAYQKDKKANQEEFEKNFAQCAESSIEVQDLNTGKKFLLNVLAASNQR